MPRALEGFYVWHKANGETESLRLTHDTGRFYTIEYVQRERYKWGSVPLGTARRYVAEGRWRRAAEGE